jgi:hypothetical protein
LMIWYAADTLSGFVENRINFNLPGWYSHHQWQKFRNIGLVIQ